MNRFGSSILTGICCLAISACQSTPEALTADEAVVQPQQLAGFPNFTYQQVVIEPTSLTFNPTNEVIFPSVIDASYAFAQPLAKYYMYYAPHDAPGGINLAYSSSLEGPWTEYASNPVIANNWSPHYAVDHVSSPHAIWVSETSQIYLYFHGSNNVTRVANTSDGINFSYDKPVIATSGTFKKIDNLTEVSYARVFKKTITRNGSSYKYIMTLMGNNNGTRKIYLCWSNDARNFSCQNTPLITPNSSESGGQFGGPQISSPRYFPWNSKHYVTYNAGSGDIHISEVGSNFTLENHLGVFYDSVGGAPENSRAASADFRTIGNTMYMFYEVGQRGATKIALAKAPL